MPLSAKEEQKKQLMERTKQNYDRKESEGGAKYFNVEGDTKIWKPAPTKGNPHMIDIIPFKAGNNYPLQSNIKEGDWVYVLDLYVHSNVGPGKAMVVCPAKNYGEPCPICDEVDELIKDNVEWKDIPFVPKRRCLYNVVVMDDAKTEGVGLQIWDVAYSYSEGAILPIAKSPRDGGLIAFASTDKSMGRSVAFDVGNDTYRKITGHRFETRDYDIPDEYVDQAQKLDQIITVLDEEAIKKILYGSGGKKECEEVPDEAAPEQESTGRSLRNRAPLSKKEDDVHADDSHAEAASEKKTLSPRGKVDTCPNGAVFSKDFDQYKECDECPVRQPCAEAADAAEILKKKQEEESKDKQPASTGRKLLHRSK